MATVPLSLGGSLPRACQFGAVAIGNFDGVHLGHQALLAETIRQARLCTGPAVAVTFSPHPLQILRPESFQPELTTIDQRAGLLHEHGAEHVVVLQTTAALLRLSAREFFEQVICGVLQARAVVEGHNFRFGRGREGTMELLAELGRERNVAVVVLPMHMGAKGQDGTPLPASSSRVRDALLAGNVAEARNLLGRPFRLAGVVRAGQKRGQALGFPTANLEEVATLIPGDGVYAASANLTGPQRPGMVNAWPAAVNIGPNPTFAENARKIEAHLIGFAGDLYGQIVTLDFIDRLRDTRPFSNVDALKKQLQDDIERTRRIVESL